MSLDIDSLAVLGLVLPGYPLGGHGWDRIGKVFPDQARLPVITGSNLQGSWQG